MKIQHVSHSDISGGAARATYRLHNALRSGGQSSKMLVQKKVSSDVNVSAPDGYLDKIGSLGRIFIAEQIVRLQTTDNYTHRTAPWPPFVDGRFLKEVKQADVINLHWFREIPGISTVGRIRQPIVWTLHDMWAFCGAEHYCSDKTTARWRTGYTSNNRESGDTGLDIDRRVWKLKKKHWQRPFHIITPSQWLADCVSRSALMADWPVHTIPNTLNVDVFKPLDRSYCREILNFSKTAKLVLFGALGGGSDKRKGFDLLQQALGELAVNKELGFQYECVVFGQSKPQKSLNINFPIHWMGHLNDDWTLSLLYNAADVVVVPSRQDNLPQTGTEAQACGSPVVAFNTTGLADVVVHKETGYLAHPFDPKELAHGISWVLESKELHHNLSIAARKRAIRLWAPDVIVPQYLDVYQQAIELNKSSLSE